MVGDSTFVIVAAGRGERFGHTAKVLVPVAGKEILRWSIEAAFAAASVSDLVVVAGAHTHEEINRLVRSIPASMPVTVVVGGATRHASVAAGVAAANRDSRIVLVHDAARPLVTAGLIDQCAAAAREYGAAIAAVPVTDTLKRVANHLIDATISRERLWARKRRRRSGDRCWLRPSPGRSTTPDRSPTRPHCLKRWANRWRSLRER